MSDNFEEIINKIFEILNSESEKKVLKATSKQILEIYNEKIKDEIKNNEKSKSKKIIKQNKKENNKEVKDKDDTKIKRPKNGYLIYSTENRANIKKQYPEDSFGEITKRLSKLWNGLNENEKNPYLKKAEEDKIRYDNEKKNLENV